MLDESLGGEVLHRRRDQQVAELVMLWTVTVVLPAILIVEIGDPHERRVVPQVLGEPQVAPQLAAANRLDVIGHVGQNSDDRLGVGIVTQLCQDHELQHFGSPILGSFS